MTELDDVLAAIGDPIRFEVLRLLLVEDGLAQSALAERLGITPSRLGNHLATLRAAGLVQPVRHGRSSRYVLRDPDAVRVLVGAVHALAGEAEAIAGAGPGQPAAAGQPAPAGVSPFARARTCYDHLAGEVGVIVLDRLVAEGALLPGPEPESVLAPGAALEPALDRLGVPYPHGGRRMLAVGCLDATAGRSHLGGALGSEILRSFLRRGLLLPGPEPRTLVEHPALAPLLA